MRNSILRARMMFISLNQEFGGGEVSPSGFKELYIQEG